MRRRGGGRIREVEEEKEGRGWGRRRSNKSEAP
jgi:hypothetical protein